jgi:putative phosphoesterase
VAALAGVETIIHAGDVADPTILDRLREIASVYAVRGNVDKGEWARSLPMTQVVEVGDALLYVLHIREELDLDPAAAGFQAVIFGHSHQPSMEWKNGVLYLNPGSIGPRRFKLPVSLALLTIAGKNVQAELVELEV